MFNMGIMPNVGGMSSLGMGGMNSIPSSLSSMGGIGSITFSFGIDTSAFSPDLMDSFGGLGNMSNMFGNNGISSLGFGSVPGFNTSCYPQGSNFGGQVNSQQMMQMMMMLQMMQMMLTMQMMMMLMQSANSGNGVSGGSGGGIGSSGIPGSSGSYAPTGTAGSSGSSDLSSVGSGTGEASVALAEKFLNQTTHDIQGLEHLDKSIGYNLNCANFVSAVLQQTGRLDGHYNNCKGLESALKSQGWRQVSASEAQPGDVWFNASRGHTELVKSAGNPPTLIGSNNGGDSIQEVTVDRSSGKSGVFYHKD